MSSSVSYAIAIVPEMGPVETILYFIEVFVYKEVKIWNTFPTHFSLCENELDYLSVNLNCSMLKFELVLLISGMRVRLTWNDKNASRAFTAMTETFRWPWLGEWMYRIVTRVTSGVGVS